MAQRPATVDRLVACQQHQNTGSFQVVGRQAVGVLHRFRLHGSGGGNDGGHSGSVVHADPVATPPGLVAGEESHVSAARHTPGPWHVAAGTQIRSAVHQIARVWMMRNGEGNANAKLIAAAPEILDALQDAVRLIEHLGGNAKLQRAAIEKATT
jgi:hypothetical protein